MSDEPIEILELPALSSLQTRVVVALAQGCSISEAALMSGVTRVTIHRWLHDPAFAAALKQIRDKYIETIKNDLQGLTGLAITKLRLLLESPKTPPGVVARVSLALLNRQQLPYPGSETAAKPDPYASEEPPSDQQNGDATLDASVASVANCNNL
jgi:hypothetical protein